MVPYTYDLSFHHYWNNKATTNLPNVTHLCLLTMSSTETTTTTTASSRPYHKRLQGVKATDDLREIIRDVRSHAGKQSDEGDDDNTAPSSPLDSALSLLSRDASVEILRNFDTTTQFIPISVLRAVEKLASEANQQRLNECLSHTTLAFTPPPPAEPETAQHAKFRRRLERLRLQQDERRYGAYVQNVGTTAVPDDVTTRSMTYAASIGLNMIVAPLSFGCFMYFFAGGVLSYFGWIDEERPAHLGPDIRKVSALSMYIYLYI